MHPAILKRFQEWGNKGYGASLPGLELLEVGEGKARLRLTVAEPVQNARGMLHGGAAATLVDVAGTIAIMSADREGRPGVTTDLNVSYFAPGSDRVIIVAEVLKTGRTLAFVTVDVRREADNAPVAQGRMTKYMV
ncbi:MAG: PaaI family thioesterase [Candidatus Xenobia bacterium]